MRVRHTVAESVRKYSVEFRDLKAQYRALRPEMDRAILETVAGAGFIGGARVKALEERLAAYVGVKHCITCGNGTDALQLMLMAWGIGPGDAVFVPDFTFFASGEAVSFVGSAPVFYDVCPDTFNGSAESLEQAFELNQKRTNQIIGGMLWMKMGDHRIQTAIDLSGLGLDTIEEDEMQFSIGCMTSLRQLELHEGLNQWSDGAVRESVRHIVGVQFRNLATVGGSLFGRFGFSDVLTCFLAMDAYVELYHNGILSLADFLNLPRDNDVLIRLIVKKTPGKCVYLSQRNTKTDFPLLTCAVCLDKKGTRVAVGARPQKAMLLTVSEEQTEAIRKNGADAAAKIADELAVQIPTQDNMRASAAYRTHLAKVLIRRALLTVTEEVQ